MQKAKEKESVLATLFALCQELDFLKYYESLDDLINSLRN